jgi:hypothetical protein
MCSLKKARIQRGPPPVKQIKRRKYRDALPELMRDFDGRCAYSMQKKPFAEMEVEHFDPRKKKKYIQDYTNLFPATRYVNGKKSNIWPTASERKKGCRFLNPCEEMDYGEQIFENPNTHELYGVTPAAKWHILMCGLNADHFIDERRKRSKYLRQISNQPITSVGFDTNELRLIDSIKEVVNSLIPLIPSGPMV